MEKKWFAGGTRVSSIPFFSEGHFLAPGFSDGVALSSALMVVASQQFGMSGEGVSRVVQGVVTGIGFIGAGTILKTREEREIEGLTTAASIWLTSGIGLAVGLGGLGLGLARTVFSLIILTLLLPVERAVGKEHRHK